MRDAYSPYAMGSTVGDGGGMLKSTDVDDDDDDKWRRRPVVLPGCEDENADVTVAATDSRSSSVTTVVTIVFVTVTRAILGTFVSLLVVVDLDCDSRDDVPALWARE